MQLIVLSIERSRRITSAQLSASRRPVIEFAEQPPVRGLLGNVVAYAGGGQAVEDAELASRRRSSMIVWAGAASKRTCSADDFRRLLRAYVRRREDDLRTLFAGSARTSDPRPPPASGPAPTRHVDITGRDVDLMRARQSAASRATLPWLCPCRTSHSRSGQFCFVLPSPSCTKAPCRNLFPRRPFNNLAGASPRSRGAG